MKRILILYYTQTGQLKEIIDSMMQPLIKDSSFVVEYLPVSTITKFPFPWSSDEFFQAFPESVLEIPFEMEPIKPQHEQYDLIILAYQPWYLSPSIPIESFLQSECANKLLNGQKVVTVIGSRNMWVMAQESIKKLLAYNNATLVGNIVLRDKAPNLLSVISIIRWLVYGKQERFLKVIPPAGVSDQDIKASERFGSIIKDALQNNSLNELQTMLNKANAVEIIPQLILQEKNGKRIFKVFAGRIIKLGAYGSPDRMWMLSIFKYYLFFVIYIVAPLVVLGFFLMYPLFFPLVLKWKKYYSGTALQ